MLFYLALSAVLACSFAQDPAGEAPPPSSCNGVVPYISKAFNALRFDFSTGYHDTNNFRSLFVSEANSDEWVLYDFVNARVSTQLNGVCYYYNNTDLYLSPATMAPGGGMETNFVTDNFNGARGMGYTIQQGQATIRGVLDADKCVEIFTYIAIDNKPYVTIFRDAFQTKNVQTKIDAALAPVLTIIDSGSCQETGLPY